MLLAAAYSKLSWDEGEDEERRGLKIVVLTSMFHPDEAEVLASMWRPRCASMPLITQGEPEFYEELKVLKCVANATYCTCDGAEGGRRRGRAEGRARREGHCLRGAWLCAGSEAASQSLRERRWLLQGNPDGVIIIRFKTAYAAEQCIEARLPTPAALR